METWRIWELVLPYLERRHDVLAPTLPGHPGGPALPERGDVTGFADALERLLDDEGIVTAHLVGASLGGHLALQLAARGRARSVVALAPAGGWAEGDRSVTALLEEQRELHELARRDAAAADAIASTPAGRRRATSLLTVRWEHLSPDLVAHLILGVAACHAAPQLVDGALGARWTLDASRITCPIRVVWGAEDRLLPWPDAAARYREEWLPHADWVVLDDVGHSPHLDVPLEAAQLILGVTTG